MGLDQYAYVAGQAGERDQYWEQGSFEDDDFVSPVPKPREIAYWRKHPNLQGWMNQLWIEKGHPGQEDLDDPNFMFNCVELELTWEDIERLERDILSGRMSRMGTRGFFFGDASDDYYRDADLKFVKDAKAELFLGLKVFYNSSW